jgi:hypothetical protein
MMYLYPTRLLLSTDDSTVFRKTAQVNLYITIITSKAHHIIITTIITHLEVTHKAPCPLQRS